MKMELRAGDGWDADVLAFAEEELNRYLEKILPAGMEGVPVRLESAPEPIRWDGFRVRCGREGISIQASCARGILHGVYELLRRLGCSFLFPGAERQTVPERLPDLPEVDALCQPWLEYRGMCLYQTTGKTLRETVDMVDWMAKNGYNFLLTSIHRADDTGLGYHAILWDEIGEALLPELQKRGIVIDMSEHSTDYFFPRESLFDQHPEWFAEENGSRRPSQICYSNPEAVEAYGERLAEFVADKPWIRFLGLWPLDGGGYCQCQACADPLTIYRACRRIAEKVGAVRPDVTVEYLAYRPQSFGRPKERLPRNMSVLVCSVRDQVAYEWGVLAGQSGGAFYFDYNTGDHYRWRGDLWLNPIWCREMVNGMAAYGYRGIVSLYLPITSWWQASINYWYLRRYYYDPTADLEPLTRELARELFGDESMTPALMRTYTGLQDSSMWNGLPRKHEWYAEHLAWRNRELDEEHLRRIHGILAELEELLSGIPLPEEPRFRENRSRFAQYLALQKIYYGAVDQYRLEEDTPARAEAYFEALRSLDGSPFIPEDYARWRIVGRDNLFAANGANAFSPGT